MLKIIIVIQRPASRKHIRLCFKNFQNIALRRQFSKIELWITLLGGQSYE